LRLVNQRLQAHYILGLETFLALGEVVFNLLPFNQRAMPFTTNRPIVDEYIGPIFALNEAITLGIVEPLYIPSLTRRHLNYSSFFIVKIALQALGFPVPTPLAEISCKGRTEYMTENKENS
jgi:hypothetical protein